MEKRFSHYIFEIIFIYTHSINKINIILIISNFSTFLTLIRLIFETISLLPETSSLEIFIT
jgi:hypothetical protein